MLLCHSGEGWNLSHLRLSPGFARLHTPGVCMRLSSPKYTKRYNLFMSTKSGKIRGHKFHGDPARFEAVADFVAERFKGKAKYIADVAGGQGMLARFLNKKYNFDAEVIDPRGYTLVGVKNRKEEYTTDMAGYYDLIIGIHPDEALKDVVNSALIRPVVVIPCCNFWSNEETLGRDALLTKIEEFYTENGVKFERIIFNFQGPKNIGLVSFPSSKQSSALANKI